jgi:hypothetical protein
MQLPTRIEDKINKAGPNGCWLWKGTIDPQGYGKIMIDGKNYRAHRIVYQALAGEIPKDHEIDHLCRTRSCVNPGHLEPVIHKINCERGVIGTNPHSGDYQRGKTHCPQGHPYDGANTSFEGPHLRWRRCKECVRIKNQKRRKGRRESGRSSLVT